MGADFKEHETGMVEILNMSPAAREYLSHHLNNSLGSLILSLELGDIEGAKKDAMHMVDDLNRVGIRSGKRSNDQAIKRLNGLNGFKNGGGL